VSRLSTQCGILNISQAYRPPLPVTGIVLHFLSYGATSVRLCSALMFTLLWHTLHESASVKAAIVSAKIRAHHLPSISVEPYCHSALLGGVDVSACTKGLCTEGGNTDQSGPSKDACVEAEAHKRRVCVRGHLKAGRSPDASRAWEN
jgi:hypothetical protein